MPALSLFAAVDAYSITVHSFVNYLVELLTTTLVPWLVYVAEI
jgi:hypothetical protein